MSQQPDSSVSPNNTDDVRVLQAIDGQSISALFPVNTAAFRGNFVRINPATLGQDSVFNVNTQLQLCSGQTGAMLERDVLNATKIPLEQVTFGTQLLTPTLQGQPASARYVSEFEIEGPDLVEPTAAGQAIVVPPAADTAITFLNGKIALINSGQAVCGWVRGILSPVYSGNIRLYIEMNRKG